MMSNPSQKLFFNYATVSPMCGSSYEAIIKFTEKFYNIGPPEVLYEYDPIAKDLALEAAKLINCSPNEITYIKNTTEGINIASETLPIEKDDEVLVLGNEYPANLFPWMKKSKEGVKVRIIKGQDNQLAFKKLIDSISPKTKIISISTAQYYDGFMPDLEALSNLCQRNGIFLILDAVQTIGIRKIDMNRIHADFLVCGGQKYLQAGTGIGFMYVNKHTMKHLKDFKVGIRSMSSFSENDYILKDNAERFQDGTQNLNGIVSLYASLKNINLIGIENIEKTNIRLLNEFKGILKDKDIKFIDNGLNQSNIISIKVSNPQALFEYLKERSIYIKPIKDVARISFMHESKTADFIKMADNIRKWMNLNNN